MIHSRQRLGIRKTMLFSGLLTLSASLSAQDNPAPYSWRGIDGSGVYPATDLVTTFHDLPKDMITEEKDAAGKVGRTLTLPGKPGTQGNIVWKTLLPFWGHSTPVVVKDRVFVITDMGWKDDTPQLVCLDAVKGDILWKGAIDQLDAYPAEKTAENRKLRAKNHAYWRQYMTIYNKLYFDDATNGMARRPKTELLKLQERLKGEYPDFAAYPWPFEANCFTTVDGVEYYQRQMNFRAVRGRYYWRWGDSLPVPPDMAAVHKACLEQRLHIRQWWASEGPFYESSFASPVSDGELIYALSQPNAVACYDLTGKRQWSADLELGARAGTLHDIASPVLVGGKLIIASSGQAQMIALDAKNGKVLWKTLYPRKPTDSKLDKQNWPDGGLPRGYEGHMGPNGTPIIMELAGTTVVISGNGIVARISDGKMLGQVKVPKGTPIGKGKGTEPAPEDYYGSSYNSWVANGDTLFFAPGAGLYAIRLRVEKDELTQTVLWRFDGGVDVRDPNLNFFDGRLYAQVNVKKVGSVSAIDPATGKVLASGPPSGGSYVVNLAFGKDRAIWKTNYQGDGSESKADPYKMMGHNRTHYTIVSLPDLKPLGEGVLCPDGPSGPVAEIAERNIAGFGMARIIGSFAGPSCWGNRIFIRGHDYLWCIGDPAKPFVAPEQVLQKKP